MSTRQPSIDEALSGITAELRTRLTKYFTQLKQAYANGDFDACGVRGGKFAETLVRVIQQSLESSHTPFGTQVNLYDEARRLEALPKSAGPEALRIFIPRALCFLYTLRNKRGFAHVGGDLDSERIDAVTCVRVADWCLAELVRVVHSLSFEDAQTIVDTLAAREVPEIWSVAGKKRVLRPGLNAKQQVLYLLYSEVADAVLIEDLLEWTEYSRMDHFKERVLKPLHQARMIEWDRATDTAILSPTGGREVEVKILGLPE